MPPEFRQMFRVTPDISTKVKDAARKKQEALLAPYLKEGNSGLCKGSFSDVSCKPTIEYIALPEDVDSPASQPPPLAVLHTATSASFVSTWMQGYENLFDRVAEASQFDVIFLDATAGE